MSYNYRTPPWGSYERRQVPNRDGGCDSGSVTFLIWTKNISWDGHFRWLYIAQHHHMLPMMASNTRYQKNQEKSQKINLNINKAV